MTDHQNPSDPDRTLEIVPPTQTPATPQAAPQPSKLVDFVQTPRTESKPIPANGGFNRQIKASFSRSAVVYMEQEDPNHRHREKVIFTVNLGDFELRYPLDDSADDRTVEDGRTLRRMVWDQAVNTLAEIVSSTGLKPKYVKNDKNSCIFTMRQYLLSENERTPDEFFTLDLRHVNEDTKDKMSQQYVVNLQAFEEEIARLRKQSKSFWLGRRSRETILQKLANAEKDRAFYVGTSPDPREMDTGLIFSIVVNTLKDYTITKDKMQVIMTRYILALSTIATEKTAEQIPVQVASKRPVAPPTTLPQQTSDTEKKVVMMRDDLMRKAAGGGGRFRR